MAIKHGTVLLAYHRKIHQTRPSARRPATIASLPRARPTISRYCVGVIAFRWWQAWRFPAGSKIGKGAGCAPEVDKPGVMGVVSGKV